MAAKILEKRGTVGEQNGKRNRKRGWRETGKKGKRERGSMKKFTFLKGFARTCGNPLMSCCCHRHHRVSAVCMQHPHKSITCFALHSSQAKRDFPLEKVISLHENHHRQPGQLLRIIKKGGRQEKCIQTKSTLTAAALVLQSVLSARQLHFRLTHRAPFACTMKCTRKYRRKSSEQIV